MSAAKRFSKAKVEFTDRRESLIPLQDEQGKAVGIASYIVRIEKITWLDAREGGKTFYIVNFEVVESNNPKVPVGAKRVWMPNMTMDSSQAAVPAFVFAASGLDRSNPEDFATIKGFETSGKLDELLAETLYEPSDEACKNSLAGALVKVEVKEIVTKKEKKPFPLHTWFPVKEATQAA